ncbi:acetylornithine deacetylase [Agrococcus sp. HG114]|uniref:acetylornithine deacetylase n=1 Tax=Agrococcus sp. HG114 TaxID=2969757 RepID=UPI00215B3791|nr:acetylornithine deacetylase [Agrococcus sp. HG114]MCR8670661.1 acetylornithine deacetylase [Agrococcus sp. HG114]
MDASPDIEEPHAGMPTAPSEATMAEIAALLRFDTTSRDSNLPLVEHAVARLAAVGVDAALVPSPEGDKANLLATIPAADGTVTGGIVLSAHTDVVPVDGQVWSSAPFEPEVRDGRLYARGAADMKSFLGVLLAKAPAMATARLAEPIHLALSYDEEVGCVGAIGLVDEIVRRGLAPRGCVVGEPTSMRIVRGHKSMNVFRVDVRGLAAHSSLTPQGENAIVAAAELVRFVQGVADELREQGPFDDGYVVPFTTVSVNRIDGGIAINTIPAECTVHFEFRALTTVDHEALVERFRAECRRIEAGMRERHPGASVTLTTTAAAPGVDTPADADIVALAAAWGGEPSDDKVTYGTEAGLFANAGIPTVVCGPGDIAQAHAPDEFIELEQIARCEALVDRLIADLSVDA